ncbi:MAG: tyrosine-type recombinase/integrase [Rhodopirellula sp.]|nr:tyrosine-type recombinase/integrase [Rhodopirellula sp.]
MKTPRSIETTRKVERAARLRGEGKTYREIAAELNVLPSRVYQWRAAYSALWKSQLPDGFESKRTVSADQASDQVRQAARLQSAGMTYSEIAAELNVSPSRVYQWRADYRDIWADSQPEGFRAKKGPPPNESFDLRNREATAYVRQQITAAARLWTEGKTYAEIGEALKTPARTVEGWRTAHVDLWNRAIEETGLVRARISPRVEEGIRKVTSLLAAGHTLQEAAAEAGAAFEAVRQWKRDHAEIWHREEERGVQAAIAVVRKMAGTDAILGDVGSYIRQAAFCDKWTRSHGEMLFPMSGETTLTTFFETWYRPVRLADASGDTVASYRSCLNKWRLLTKDPPVQEITAQTLALFRDAAAKSPGKDGVTRASPNTVRANLRHIQTVLDKCGKPGRRNRDAAGLVSDPPWVKPPRAEWSMRKTVTEEQVNAIYRAAFSMDAPKLWATFKPSAWWKCFIVTAWSTGLRRRSLFELEWSHVDWDKRWLFIPAKHLKGRRPMITPLTDVTLEHLRSIRSDRTLVFPWPAAGSRDAAMKAFGRCWDRLLTAADIPPAERFTLHSLRRTLGTSLWDASPAAAQLMLGHSEAETTRQHYVRAPEIIARAMAGLPVPEAFLGV